MTGLGQKGILKNAEKMLAVIPSCVIFASGECFRDVLILEVDSSKMMSLKTYPPESNILTEEHLGTNFLCGEILLCFMLVGLIQLKKGM